MDKKLYNSCYTYNNQGHLFHKEMVDAIKPILSRWIRDNYDIHDLERIVNNIVMGQIALEKLNRVIEKPNQNKQLLDGF